MKLSLNPATIGTCNFEESVTFARQAGFNGIGLRYALLTDYLHRGHSIRDARHVIEESGLVPTEMGFFNGWMFHDGIPLAGKRKRSGETNEQLLEEMHRLFSITRELGSPPITALVALEEVGKIEKAAEEFGWLCDQAAAYGLRLMLEFTGNAPQVNRIRDAWELIRASQRRNSGLLLDSFLMFMGEFHLEDLEQIPEDRILSVHIADAKPKPLHELDMLKDRLIPGLGVIPLQALVRALYAMKYDGFFTIEIFNEEYAKRPPAEIAAWSRNELARLLEECNQKP